MGLPAEHIKRKQISMTISATYLQSRQKRRVGQWLTIEQTMAPREVNVLPKLYRLIFLLSFLATLSSSRADELKLLRGRSHSDRSKLDHLSSL